MAKVSFKTALKLTGDFDRDDDIIHVKPDGEPEYRGERPMTVETAKKRFDLKNEKVVRIESYFLCDEYSGFLYILERGTKIPACPIK